MITAERQASGERTCTNIMYRASMIGQNLCLVLSCLESVM